MKYNTLTDFYTEGYNCGYNWLNPDKPYANNFKHPSVKGGYIPGGPGNYYDPRYNKAMYDLYYAGNRLWRNAWVEGINAYVRDNNLEYPEVLQKDAF